MEPTVLTGVNLPRFINLILEKHTAPSIIVACMAKEAFLERVMSDISQASNDQPENENAHSALPKISRDLLQQPSLRLLATSQTIKLVFCPDLSRLRAYLAVLSPHASSQTTEPASESSKHPLQQSILAMVDVLEVHRPTSAFSAQGLNRTFSLAVEAAHRTGSRLIVAECATKPGDAQAATPPEEMAGVETSTSLVDPWDEEVSILNVTTKSFGAGGRGWVGRTVKLRHVAERWCHFEAVG